MEYSSFEHVRAPTAAASVFVDDSTIVVVILSVIHRADFLRFRHFTVYDLFLLPFFQDIRAFKETFA